MFSHHPVLKVASILMLGVFLFVVTTSLSIGMIMNMNGTMSPCPFMNDDGGICPMSLVAHVAGWQQLSTALPTAVSAATFTPLIFCFALFAVFQLQQQLQLLRHFRKRNFEIKTFSTLFFALSRGIMHSRLFA